MKSRLLAQGQNGNEDATSGPKNNYYKHAEWSPDGTCVITNSSDNHIRTYIIPPNLLEERGEPLDLRPYSIIPSLEPVNTQACYPGFDLQNPSTTLILSAATEHPIRLHSALTSQLVASYPLISATTEVYVKPTSLVITPDGTKFIAGSDRLISLFELSRPGDGPVLSCKTGPKTSKAKWSNPGTAVRGLISALDIDRQYNVLAAGTLDRQVGLYDSGGQGECVGAFSVAGTLADLAIGGSGITQVGWTRCGRYLYVTERKSNGSMIYDIRNTGQLLSWVTGRNAMTNQRMKVQLAYDVKSGSQNAWAGGMDGIVRVWKEPHLYEGEVEPALTIDVHADRVNGISAHPTADVLVTASGQRQMSSTGSDNSMKLWQMPSCNAIT